MAFKVQYVNYFLLAISVLLFLYSGNFALRRRYSSGISDLETPGTGAHSQNYNYDGHFSTPLPSTHTPVIQKPTSASPSQAPTTEAPRPEKIPVIAPIWKHSPNGKFILLTLIRFDNHVWINGMVRQHEVDMGAFTSGGECSFSDGRTSSFALFFAQEGHGKTYDQSNAWCPIPPETAALSTTTRITVTFKGANNALYLPDLELPPDNSIGAEKDRPVGRPKVVVALGPSRSERPWPQPTLFEYLVWHLEILKIDEVWLYAAEEKILDSAPIAAHWARTGRVRVVDWRHIVTFHAWLWGQNAAIADTLLRNKGRSEWMVHMDADEFIFSRSALAGSGRSNNTAEDWSYGQLLQQMESQGDGGNANEWSMFSMFFGVMDRPHSLHAMSSLPYRYPAFDVGPSWWGRRKYVVHTSRTRACNQHEAHPWAHYSRRDMPEAEAYIRHFRCPLSSQPPVAADGKAQLIIDCAQADHTKPSAPALHVTDEINAGLDARLSKLQQELLPTAKTLRELYDFAPYTPEFRHDQTGNY